MTHETVIALNRLAVRLQEAAELVQSNDFLADAYTDGAGKAKLGECYASAWETLLRLNWILNSHQPEAKYLRLMGGREAAYMREPPAAAAVTDGGGGGPASAEPTAQVKKPRRQIKRELFDKTRQQIG